MGSEGEMASGSLLGTEGTKREKQVHQGWQKAD